MLQKRRWERGQKERRKAHRRRKQHTRREKLRQQCGEVKVSMANLHINWIEFRTARA